MKQTWKDRIVAFAKGWVGSLIIALVLATSIKSAIADWYVVPTGSMIPTIIEGDRIFVNKLAYDLKVPYTTWHLSTWDNPERGDVVVFWSPKDGKRLVKRVVGLPGDMVSMASNRLYINGKPVKYEMSDFGESTDVKEKIGTDNNVFLEKLPSQPHVIMTTQGGSFLESFSPVKLSENSYWMMGDNRDNSADSRVFGAVDRSQILGRATSIVMSLNPDRHYLPRWNRFFITLN